MHTHAHTHYDTTFYKYDDSFLQLEVAVSIRGVKGKITIRFSLKEWDRKVWNKGWNRWKRNWKLISGGSWRSWVMAYEDRNRLRAQRTHSTSCCYDSIKSLSVEGHHQWQIWCQAPDAARPRRQSFHGYQPHNMVICSKLKTVWALDDGVQNPILACSLVSCERTPMKSPN